MPTVADNMEMWNRKYNWSMADSDWSSEWGDMYTEWYNTLLPRIYPFIPTGTILEIAPGFGRWTRFLVDKCERLILVDLSEKCIKACRERFGRYSHITYHVNDGRSLDFVPNQSIDFLFSFDSLVHAEDDVVSTYLHQLPGKLTDNGIGFIHHSNLADHADYLARLARIPPRVRRWLIDWRFIETLDSQWRAPSMSAKKFEQYSEAAGLVCVAQEVINWHSTRLIDCISLVTKPNSRWSRANRTIRNGHFMREANYSADLARLYGKNGWPESARGDRE